MILAVIPARGGSKGLAGKNILPLAGRPLIAWSIDAARDSRLIDRFLVSTEDKEIAAVARQEGAEVLPRPPELAADDTTTVAVLQHVLEEVPADVVVLLQPTSPVRVEGIVDQAIQRFLDGQVDSLATGSMLKAVEWGTMDNTPRQEIQGFFYDDGNIYVHRADVLRRGRWYGDKIDRMLLPRQYNFEIDEQVDLWAVEAILSRLLQDSQTG